MCLIVHKPAGESFPIDDIKSTVTRNNDGFGYMYWDPEAKRIRAAKQINSPVEKIIERFEKLTPFEACFHFRMKTHGRIHDEQCHPFQTLFKKTHKMDMFFMHNGVIRLSKTDPIKSDTQLFNTHFLRPILKYRGDLIETEAFQEMVEKYIGSGNKLCFMYGEGKVLKLNEDQGHEYNNCWVSNLNFSPCKNQKSYSYSGYNANSGGSTSRPTPPHCGYGDWDGDAWDKWEKDDEKNKSPNSSVVPINSNKQSGVVKSVTFLGRPLYEGDKVVVLDKSNKAFAEEGTVTRIITYMSGRFDVTFMKDNKEISCTFESDSGLGTIYPQYQVMPMEDWVNLGDTDESISTKQDESVEESRNLELEKENSKSEEQSKDNLPVSQDPVEPNEQEEHVLSEYEIQEQVFQLSDLVKNGDPDVTIDTLDRWGGLFIEDSFMDYSGYTFNDVYKMSHKDRAKFFVNNPHIALNMFIDLVEYICLQDIEDEEEEEFESQTLAKAEQEDLVDAKKAAAIAL